LDEHGEREMRAVWLLREGIVQIPYLSAHRGKVMSRVVQHQPVLSESRVFLVFLKL
jgi:hypothetical protein